VRVTIRLETCYTPRLVQAHASRQTEWAVGNLGLARRRVTTRPSTLPISWRTALEIRSCDPNSCSIPRCARRGHRVADHSVFLRRVSRRCQLPRSRGAGRCRCATASRSRHCAARWQRASRGRRSRRVPLRSDLRTVRRTAPEKPSPRKLVHDATIAVDDVDQYGECGIESVHHLLRRPRTRGGGKAANVDEHDATRRVSVAAVGDSTCRRKSWASARGGPNGRH